LKKEPSDYRPDITHQLLLTLHDSPINKAGLMKTYIRTAENHLVDVSASMKIPRTYKRFSLLILQLLKRLRVRAVESSETLLKVIKNPVTKHLPETCLRFGTSTKGKMVNMNEYVMELNTDEPIAFVIGAVAKGNPAMEVDYIH
jgi:rRNA small subunit pseudouridine methyltransferase Nep1